MFKTKATIYFVILCLSLVPSCILAATSVSPLFKDLVIISSICVNTK